METITKSEFTLIEAINNALSYEMAKDQNVVIFGEDVGLNGGVFRATDGLQKKFGAERVFNTPLAEALISGVAVGMATYGLRPVAEIQFMGFIYAAMEHIVCHASRMRNRTRGRLSCPLVIRAPFGGGIHAPELHSESTEAMFAHIPGLRVVVPSSPKQAYGLLLSAIRNPDPVIFLEPKRIYRSIKEEVNLDGQGLPLDRAFILREGYDVTLVSWGASIVETMAAASELSDLGIEAEVIDLATIKPFDSDTILDSVAKTGRLVIVHEAARTGGVGAEISAVVAEEGLMFLMAPVQRVTGYDTIMPYFQKESFYIPSAREVKNAVLKTMEYQ